MSPDNSKEVQEGKFFAVISYISFFCILSMLLKKENKFALFHAKQGLALFVLEVACFMLSIIPILNWFMQSFGSVLFVLVSLWGVIQALRGKMCRIPLIANIAEKIVL